MFFYQGYSFPTQRLIAEVQFATSSLEKTARTINIDCVPLHTKMTLHPDTEGSSEHLKLSNSLKGLDFDEYPALEEVHFSGMWAQRFEHKLPHGFLTIASFFDCSIPSLTILSACTALESLRVKHCALSSLAGLQQLPWIRKLDISGNRLTSLSVLTLLESLESLDYSDNCFAAHPDLSSHTKLSNLTVALVPDVSIACMPPNLRFLETTGEWLADGQNLTRMRNLECFCAFDLTERTCTFLQPLSELVGCKPIFKGLTIMSECGISHVNAHNLLLDLAISFAPMRLPRYVLLHIFNYLLALLDDPAGKRPLTWDRRCELFALRGSQHKINLIHRVSDNYRDRSLSTEEKRKRHLK